MTKQLVRLVTAVMTMLLALVLLWQFRIVVLYVLVSITVAAALRPLSSRLVGRGLLVRLSWILLYLVALGTVGLLLFLTGEAAIKEIRQLAPTVSMQDGWRLPIWWEGGSFQQELLARLPPPAQLFEAVIRDQRERLLPAVLGFTQGIGGVVSGMLVILFLSIYWSINQSQFERLWLSLLPPARRTQARSIWRTIERDIGAYVRSQVIQSLPTGLVLGVGYWLLGSPYPALLALTGALASLIPAVGGALVIIPVVLIGLLTGAQHSLVTALYAVVVMIAMRVWLRPKLLNRSWDSPIVTVILILALADAFGLAGIIIAPPLSVVIGILWNRLFSFGPASGAEVQISDLLERRDRVLATIGAMEGPHMPLVTGSMEQLTRLIARAEPILQVEDPLQRADLPAGSFESQLHTTSQPEQEV